MSLTISVVIPCFNAAETIGRCLSSVLGQTLSPLEVIVIDDCSCDDTPAIVCSFAEGTTALSVIYRRLDSNLGPASARNLGISIASGQYLAFLDADDYWLPNHLAVASDVLVKHAGDIAVSSSPIILDSKELNAIPLAYAGASQELVCQGLSITKMVLLQRGYCTPALVAARESIIRAGCFPDAKRFAEDFEFFLRLRRQVDGWIEVKKPPTVVVGKHLWASGKGLSSHHWKMYRGTVSGLRRAFCIDILTPLSIGLEIWFFLKYLRRIMVLLVSFIFRKKR